MSEELKLSRPIESHCCKAMENCESVEIEKRRIGGKERWMWEQEKKSGKVDANEIAFCPYCGADLNRRTQQPNEPLTLEELREMDGEPVWVESHGASFTHGDGWYISANKFHLSGYGKTWLAYRRPPEAGGKE